MLLKLPRTQWRAISGTDAASVSAGWASLTAMTLVTRMKAGVLKSKRSEESMATNFMSLVSFDCTRVWDFLLSHDIIREKS